MLNNIEIQKSKVKNKNDNSKRKKFNLCSVTLHFYFYFLHFIGICLELGAWILEFSSLRGINPHPTSHNYSRCTLTLLRSGTPRGLSS